MEHKSEHLTANNGATVEVATVIFEGREFTNLGSVVDEARGLLVGYPVERKDPAPGESRYVLQTFDGKPIAPVTLVSKWRQRVAFGGFGFDVYAWRAEYNGRTYSGRNAGNFAGPNMILRLRARRAS